MNSILKNELKKLPYNEPEEALRVSGVFRIFTSASTTGSIHRDWRHHIFENLRENEQAAWFAYGLKATGIKPDVQFAHYPKKDRDFDAAIRWSGPKRPEFATVQLKEVVPEDRCLTATLEQEITKFQRYDGTEELIGVVFVNREMHFNPDALQIPELKLRELWIFGLSGQGELRGLLFGDLLRQPQHYEFALPNLRWGSSNDLPWRQQS